MIVSSLTSHTNLSPANNKSFALRHRISESNCGREPSTMSKSSADSWLKSSRRKNGGGCRNSKTSLGAKSAQKLAMCCHSRAFGGVVRRHFSKSSQSREYGGANTRPALKLFHHGGPGIFFL